MVGTSCRTEYESEKVGCVMMTARFMAHGKR